MKNKGITKLEKERIQNNTRTYYRYNRSEASYLNWLMRIRAYLVDKKRVYPRPRPQEIIDYKILTKWEKK